jgi:hypothetical protein
MADDDDDVTLPFSFMHFIYLVALKYQELALE